MSLRPLFGVTLIPAAGFYRQALSLLRQRAIPKLLVVIADQRPAPGNDKFHILFLDRDTAVQTGGERIASSSDAAAVYVESRKNAQFKYEFTFSMMENASPIASPEHYKGILPDPRKRTFAVPQLLALVA